MRFNVKLTQKLRKLTLNLDQLMQAGRPLPEPRLEYTKVVQELGLEVQGGSRGGRYARVWTLPVPVVLPVAGQVAARAA